MSDNTSSAFRHFIDSALHHALSEFYSNSLIYEKFFKVASVFLPFIALYIFYEYIEYLVIVDAYNYEKSMRKRYNFIRKMANKLKHLSKEHGELHFCYLPMNHGVNVPPTYTLFQAIKEILNRNSRPASRRICISILLDLARSYYDTDTEIFLVDRNKCRRRIGQTDCEIQMDPLNDFNLNIMQFTREMVIHGVKDLEIMATLHHLTEGILDI